MIQNKKHQKGLVPSRPSALARRNENTEEGSLFGAALKGSLWGLLTSGICGIILITLATAAAYANPDSAALVSPLGLVSLMPSMFAGGFVTSKRVKEAPLLCGIMSGGMMTLVTMLLGMILRGLPTSSYEFWQSAALHGAAILFSILGALAGNIKKHPKPGKKRFG